MIVEVCDSCGKQLKTHALRNVIVYTDTFTDEAGSKDVYENAFCLCNGCACSFKRLMESLTKKIEPQVYDVQTIKNPVVGETAIQQKTAPFCHGNTGIGGAMLK